MLQSVTNTSGGGAYTTTVYPRSFRRIGNNINLDSGLTGKFQEFILYNSDQTNNQNAINSNINSYYQIY